MGSRRTLILLAAVLIGALAAYSLYSYVNGIEDRAYDNAERVKVYVVEHAITKNTPGAEAIGNKLVVADEIPEEFLPTTAITDPSEIQGRVALTDLAPNQVVVQGMFVDPTTASVTFSERLNPDEVAITVSVDQVHGAANLPSPGDRVHLMVVLDEADATATGTKPMIDAVPGAVAAVEGAPQSSIKAVRMLYQNVRIFAIDQTPAPEVGATETAETPRSGLITFAVPVDAAQRIALAQEAGRIYMTLAPEDWQPADVRPVDASNLFQPGRLTPYPLEG